MTIGIDIGSSACKIAVCNNEKIIKVLGFNKELELLEEELREILEDNNIDFKEIEEINVTGIGGGGINSILGRTVKHVEEFRATAKGALFLSGKDEAIVVSMGTGTAFIRASFDNIARIGGTGAGAGMIMGMCKHLYQIDDFKEIDELSQKGDISKVDLKIKDLFQGSYDMLNKDLTAANLTRIKEDADKEDIMLGMINMTLEVIGMMIVLIVKYDTIKDVVLTGGLTEFNKVPKVFEMFKEFMGLNFVIPENARFATAIGAVRLKGNEIVT